MFRIVSVEDDRAISKMLSDFFLSKGYSIFQTEFGSKAISLIKNKKPDIILLDWMLSDIDGIRLVKKIRALKNFKTIPIIMLTAKSNEIDVIKGLNKGADDYITKPFSLSELNARIHSLLRRSHGFDSEGKIKINQITIDPSHYQLSIKNKSVQIHLYEFRLLYFLIKNKNIIFSRSQLLDEIWGNFSVIDERTVDVNILRIRKILKKYHLAKRIETIRGMGYRFISK